MDQYSNLSTFIDKDNIKGIIFDFDKTLYFLNTDYDSLRSEINMYINKYTNMKSIILSLSEMIEIKNKSPETYQGILKIVNRYEMDGYKKGYPNVELINIITRFKDKCAIYSMNTISTINMYLADYGLTSNFDIIYSQETISSPKPSKIELEKIVKQWCFDKKSILFIGDSEGDIKSGLASGITTYVIKMNN